MHSAHKVCAPQEAETIHHFAGQGDADKVMALIAGGTPVDSRDPEGCTPLHWACDRGAVELVRKLLEAGATIDAVEDSGCAPLHYAAAAEHSEVRCQWPVCALACLVLLSVPGCLHCCVITQLSCES